MKWSVGDRAGVWIARSPKDNKSAKDFRVGTVFEIYPRFVVLDFERYRECFEPQRLHEVGSHVAPDQDELI